MKAPLFFTIIILLLGALLCVRESYTLSDLREKRQSLEKEISSFESSSNSSSVSSKRKQRKKELVRVDVKEFAERFTAYMMGMAELEKNGGRANFREWEAYLKDLDSFNEGEFRELIRELKSRDDIEEKVRENSILSIIRSLSSKFPETAFELLFSESPNLHIERKRMDLIALSMFMDGQTNSLSRQRNG